jgi:hypothetical protein
MIRYTRIAEPRAEPFYLVEMAPYEHRKGGHWDTVAKIIKSPEKHRWEVHDLVKNGKVFYCASLSDAKTMIEAFIIRAVYTARYVSKR